MLLEQHLLTIYLFIFFHFSLPIATLPDTTPPVIVGCPSDMIITILPGALTGVASWTQPIAIDDSNMQPAVEKSHQPAALFPVGDTKVSYVFSDSAGNQAECTFTVTGMYSLLDHTRYVFIARSHQVGVLFPLANTTRV